MAYEIRQKPGRQKSVRRLRQAYMRMLVITIVMLVTLCAVLIVRLRSLDGTIANLTAQLGMLSRVVEDQKMQIAHLSEELRAAGRKENSEDNRQSEGQEAVRGEETGGVQQTISQVTAAHKVYLTFDDGPSSHTEDILAVLEQYGIKATFFVVGKEGEANKEVLNQILEEGHTLGMHSGTHKYGELYSSLESFAEDFTQQRQYLYDITGEECTLYRFPGGSSNTVKSRGVDMAELAEYLEGQGVRFFDWNISSGDGGSVVLPVETLVENCTKNIRKYGTAVILMHDTKLKTTTLEALPLIIETIQAMEDTVILPITEETELIQHIKWKDA